MNRRKFLTTSALAVPVAVSSLSAMNKPRISKRRVINFKGKIFVNGKPMTKHKKIKASDSIKTGKNSFINFAIGEDAFRVGSNAKVMFKGSNNVNSIVIKAGKLVGVFKRGNNRKIKTNNATMGIRGTGIYVNAISPTKTKFCNCYGKTTAMTNSKSTKQSLEATHHKSIVIENNEIYKPSMWNGLYQYFINPSHTDEQLRDLEYLVGRLPAFDRNGKKPFMEL